MRQVVFPYDDLDIETRVRAEVTQLLNDRSRWVVMREG